LAKLQSSWSRTDQPLNAFSALIAAEGRKLGRSASPPQMAMTGNPAHPAALVEGA
jgi:hypothetical protein